MNHIHHPLKRFALLLCLLALVLTGCRSAEVTTSLTRQYAGNDMDSQMNFWHSLNDKKLISHDEAFHGVLLFYCEADNARNYADRVNRLKKAGFLSKKFDGLENQAITRGQLASILAKLLKVKGGVMMQLFGPIPRYALKEMVALRIFPQSSTQQVLNGAQLLEIMGKAEDHQLQTKRKQSAQELDNTANATGQSTPDADKTVTPKNQSSK